MTVRLRLTLLYGVLFLATGAGLLTLTYLFVAHSPWPGEPDAPEAPDLDLPGDEPTVEAPDTPTPTLPDAVADASATQRDDDLDRLLTGSLVALGAMTLASAGLGWFVAGRVLRPLATMTTRARQISAENLHERLAATGPDDELKTLADTLDDLLGRLDAAFESQRRFVANASHELRTPLTVQRTLVEVALADPDADAASLRAVSQQVLGNVEDQERLIDALLVLARSQRGVERRTPTDLAALTADLLADRETPVAARGLRVTARLDHAPVSGDAELLGRMVANLLDNAVRHNVDGGWIEVTTGVAGDGYACLRVANSGERLDAGDLPRLFEPFRRNRTERAGAGPGTGGQADGVGVGLGLSIVDAIVRAHQGWVDARPVPDGGLAVEVRFPAALTRNADEPSGRG